MDRQVSARYLRVLREQLIPATGCTEPIALASEPESVTAQVSGSIIKNAKSVVVPGTDGLKGIEAAIAAGIVAGDADRKLEVLAGAGPDTRARVEAFLTEHTVSVSLSQSGVLFDILLTLTGGGHTAKVRIAGHHTNVILLERDGRALLDGEAADEVELDGDDVSSLQIGEIMAFADTCDLTEVGPIIDRQISCNTALADAGLRGAWGAEIGKTLLSRTDNPDTLLRAKARAAAGSDARMSGCDLPAVINSGSGNQGVTVTLPVVEYAEALGAGREALIRALVLANLTSIRIKQAIGYLSAYCGAVCAGCGAGAGIAYLHGGDQSMIEHTIVNGLAILSGTICDGAKPSCAAKIAMSVEAGVLGFQMAQRGREFVHGEGIVKKGIENTIRQVGALSRDGMAETDKVILEIMLRE